MCIWYLINTSVLYFFRLCRLLRSVKRTPAKKKKCLLKCCGLLVLAYQTWSTGLLQTRHPKVFGIESYSSQ